ncbi:hypothetical protein M426DRAFT_22108 [Hypoxylon sp. CI-4A]|nr:hypothetical protein M426DRAFT_22108 [Hypoxylon sp. CI-4A]
MAKKSAPSVAYFEEVDDDDIALPGTIPKYARSTAPSNSPPKEKPNTSRSRRDSFHRESKAPISSSDSDSTEPPVRRDSKVKMKGEKKRDRRESLVVKQQRPLPRSHKTAPPPSSRISDESSYYGVHPHQTVAPASSARPRARTRPESYYGQRPPIAGSAYSHQGPHSQPFPPPAFPPGPWMAGGPPPPMGPPPPHMGHAMVHQPIPSPGYGDLNPGRDLASRFRRPSSAMGFQPPPPKPLEYDPPPVKEKALTRRASAARKASKDHGDSRRMPPPPRPASTQPNRLSFRPPQPSHVASRRKSVGFDEGDMEGDDGMYKAVARREVEYGSGALPSSRPRRQSFGEESFYDINNSYEMEPASRGRRGSFYNFEEKLRDASSYQDHVSGPGTALTSEALRRVKNEGSSHSTRSSASRDESDYKQSATTRTTRDSDGDDDITIKLPMGAVIEVGNTKIHCRDGGDINIGRNNKDNSNNNNNGASRGGSDHAPSTSSDERSERKSRGDRAATRTRTGSYSRTRHTAPPMYPHPPPPPAYPYEYDDQYDTPSHYDARSHYDTRSHYAPYLDYQDDDEFYYSP